MIYRRNRLFKKQLVPFRVGSVLLHEGEVCLLSQDSKNIASADASNEWSFRKSALMSIYPAIESLADQLSEAGVLSSFPITLTCDSNLLICSNDSVFKLTRHSSYVERWVLPFSPDDILVQNGRFFFSCGSGLGHYSTGNVSSVVYASDEFGGPVYGLIPLTREFAEVQTSTFPQNGPEVRSIRFGQSHGRRILIFIPSSYFILDFEITNKEYPVRIYAPASIYRPKVKRLGRRFLSVTATNMFGAISSEDRYFVLIQESLHVRDKNGVLIRELPNPGCNRMCMVPPFLFLASFASRQVYQVDTRQLQ